MAGRPKRRARLARARRNTTFPATLSLAAGTAPPFNSVYEEWRRTSLDPSGGEYAAAPSALYADRNGELLFIGYADVPMKGGALDLYATPGSWRRKVIAAWWRGEEEAEMDDEDVGIDLFSMLVFPSIQAALTSLRAGTKPGDSFKSTEGGRVTGSETGGESMGWFNQ